EGVAETAFPEGPLDAAVDAREVVAADLVVAPLLEGGDERLPLRIDLAMLLGVRHRLGDDRVLDGIGFGRLGELLVVRLRGADLLGALVFLRGPGFRLLAVLLLVLVVE